MGKVFLSHSHEDKTFVRRLVEDLESAGIGVWLDESEIKIGDSLIRRIGEAINEVEYVIACISPSSVRSNWVTKELDVAMTKEIEEKRVVVLPILLPGCRSDEIPPFLSDKRYADFRESENYESEFRSLISRLRLCMMNRLLYEDILGSFDVRKKNQAVEASTRDEEKDYIINYLFEEVNTRPNPSDRYWMYIALGEIGGRKAEVAIIKGLSDENEFARLGAREALKIIRNQKSD